VKTYDFSELAVRNLRESFLRNSLTTVGIAVGVASLVAMLALGIGLQQLASRRLQRSGLFDTVLVTSRRDLRGFNREEENGPPPAESPALDESARQKIAQLPDVAEVFPDMRFITDVQFEGKPHLTMIAGLPFSARNSDALEGLQGVFFSSETAPETILQKAFAAQLLGRRSRPGVEDPPVSELAKPLLGKELVMRYAERTAQPATPEGKASDEKLSGNSEEVLGASYSVVSHVLTLKIVGVTDLDPDGMRGGGQARVYIPLGLAESLHVVQPTDMRDTTRALGGTPTYSRLSVRIKSPKNVESIEDAIKKMGFNAFSIVDATRGMRQFFAVLDLFLGIFGSLALAVASIGIVNTLVMAILERRREIGIMKAIGASDTDVKKLFFAEAGVMGLFGGVTGVALGWAIGRVINVGANVYLRRQHFPPEQIWSTPWWLVIGAIVFAGIVSLISGLYPAARAARLDPVQALRYE
jgi:putative ABC transport system permease protein